jgi:pyrimidine-nucleoside phosphorylase/thymidine phosphorylase
MVLVTRASEPTPPCGACREALRAFAPQLTLVSVTAAGDQQTWAVPDLLPEPAPAARPGAIDPRLWIARKRDGHELATDEIRALVAGLVRGEVMPYQMAAFMMAVFWRGMSRREICDLTAAMLASGTRLDHGSLPGARVDKHSTGGVGDKISIPLLPLALAAGLRVPMISGRGLGHTGGTLDKLDTIPGYRSRLPVERLVGLTRDPGGFIAGQTAELVPADRIMYGLRDVSATIESVPLIVSSILSKKLTAGLTGLVLDVKYGRGAFMPGRAQAEHLASVLVAVAGDLGLPAVALLTRMEEPIGRAVGNALEVREGLQLLTDGDPSQDLRELTTALGGLMMALSGMVPTMAAGAERLEALRAGGRGAEMARLWIAAQGGDPAVVSSPDLLEVAEQRRVVTAQEDGYVQRIDARRAGELCMQLGGGRRRAEDPIDGGVGLWLHCQRGVSVRRGDALFTLHLPEGASADEAIAGEADLVQIAASPPAPASLVTALVTTRGVFEDPWNVPLREHCQGK